MKKIFLVIFLLSLTAGAFERLALVDGFDYANIFDTETASGNRQVLDHVLLTGANTILWRNCSGGLMRYPSAEERLPLAANSLDMRRLPDSRVPFGWLNYHLAQPDIIRDMMDECAKRGLARGIHWPYEETHWSNWTLGAWNLAHPQFWGVTANGKPWSGRTSLAFPEVRAYKLRLLDELLARGADIIYIDLFRNGGWGPQYEYVKPNIEAWRTRHGGEPPANVRDPRWLALVAESQHAFFRAVRARLDKQPRKVRLILGIMNARTDGDSVYESRAIDWRRLTDEGILDGVAVMSVAFDLKDVWNSTRAIYRSFASVRGKVRVYFPVAAYNYSQSGIPAYVKATGESPAQVAKHLTELAREYGDGIVMECVDYKNYPPDVCAAMTNETIRGAARVQARAEILWTRPICKQPGRYIGWPTVSRTPQGDIMALFSGDRDEHICPWGKVQMVRSADGGESWTTPTNICNTLLDDRDAGLACAKNGTMVMSWFTSIVYRRWALRDPEQLTPGSPRYYWWKHDEKIPDVEEARYLGSFTRRSTDGGHTWEDPVRVLCSSPHGPVPLSDGRWLFMGSSGNRDLALGGVPGRIIAVESRDDGRTWREIGEVPFPKTISVLKHCCEPHVVETSDGRLVVQIRCEHLSAGIRGSLQSESADGGRTWTEAREVGINGFPPHLIRLSGGRLLSVYGRRWDDMGQFACLSDDQGRTWDAANEIKLVGHWNDDLGYPSSTELPDGSILTLYYQADQKGEKTCLMATKWRVR